MKKAFLGIALLLLAPSLVLPDAGVLIPRDQAQPNPAILSLEEMEITIRIDNGDARVFVRQVFANHTTGIEEGNYVFALPSRATVSDFGVWDGPTRIPAVILERKRAGELYEQIKQQSIDPGLAADGRARNGGGQPQRGVQRTDRSDPGVRHETPRIRIPRVHPGRELEVLLCRASAAGRLSGPGGAPSADNP